MLPILEMEGEDLLLLCAGIQCSLEVASGKMGEWNILSYR